MMIQSGESSKSQNYSYKSIIVAALSISISIFFTVFFYGHDWKRKYTSFHKVLPKKFICNLPYGRLSNRYFGIMIMVRFAYYLNRTFVLPPYYGTQMDELFDLDGLNRQVGRNDLIITWRMYQQLNHNISCFCSAAVYFSNPNDVSPICKISNSSNLCSFAKFNPILGKRNIQLLSVDDLVEILDPFMVITGRFAWEYRSLPGLSEAFKSQSNKTQHIHLTFAKSIWDKANQIHRWLVSRSKSSNNSTLAIHIRRGDLAKKMNLTVFLTSAKAFSSKNKIVSERIFIATDAEKAELEIIRQTFQHAQIGCPVKVSADCKKQHFDIVIEQAVASLTTNFIGSSASSFTGVINTMRMAKKTIQAN